MTGAIETPLRRIAIAVLTVTVAAVSLLAVASAQASSIVFTKGDGNVWLAKPDGSGQYRVTLDGTSGTPYEGPSQADDGTIVAARGWGSDRRIYRMTQNGTLLNDPIATVGVADEPRISPDGKLVAYWFLTPVSYTDCSYCVGVYDQAVYTYPDRLTRYEEIPGPHCCEQPSWMANQGIFLTNGSGTAWYHRLGDPEAKEWFSNGSVGMACCPGFRDGEVSPGLDRIALVRGDQQETIQLYQANGPPPANPTPGCTISGASGGKFIGPTWSPDGQSLAWEDADGIVIAKIPSVTDCDAINAANAGGMPLITGGHRPDWGPADVNPPSRDNTPPQTSITTGPASGSATRDRTPAFGFRSSELGSSFQCRVDSRAWAPCRSPKTIGPLTNRLHTFAVRATDKAGNTDPTPARRSFRVDTVAPGLTLTGPSTVSTRGSSARARFSFKASEPARFACKVDAGAFKGCRSPYTTRSLAIGKHRITVRAIDRARNQATKSKPFAVVRKR